MNTLLLTAGATTGGSLVSMLVIYAVIIGLMWFILIRPQKKQQKQKPCSIFRSNKPTQEQK